jgi:hypothetical protein
MGTVTGTTLQQLLNLSNSSDSIEICEIIIDQAINKINLHGRTDLPNLSGTAGSKTVSLDSRQEGAVIGVAATVYSEMYVGSGSSTSSYSVGAVSTSSSSQAVTTAAREAGRALAEIEVDVG